MIETAYDRALELLKFRGFTDPEKWARHAVVTFGDGYFTRDVVNKLKAEWIEICAKERQVLKDYGLA